MSQRTGIKRRTWQERALSLLLAAVLLIGLAPGMTLPASAEHWADTYLDQLVDWGVMRADQTGNPNAALTRAEFMAIINRAYGYTEKGEIPFTDVNPTDWFYDDVAIAYTVGYMAGTSENTASPNNTLTREQAARILGRNMMLKETPGESLAFTDSRDVSDWARGTIKTAVDNYIISGYPDNTFMPRSPVSKGQMAALITQCIGTPVRESGAYELGGVFGNVTITAPNVTLRNTTISGDLYVSGGVGLGGIKLENVNVLGRIIVSGTGESESGDASVVMRNVTAEEMLVDNMRNKTVTIRADGVTDIAKTVVRTSAYLEDNNTDEKGLMNIELDGEPGTRLTLAGRIKNVVNKSPVSTIQVAKGTVAKLTVDEAATDSAIQLDRNTHVKEMNLDVATNVTGDGDIDNLNINASGCVVSPLPDKIYIRPGLTGNISGVVMDSQAAEEGSLDPRLLAGYPAAKDIAPTGFRADFSGNKKGTVYWAVSNITDGSIDEDSLVTPPTYGFKALSSGSVVAPTGDTVVSAQVTGLTTGGSYYLSAVLVDDQGNRSPVKVVSFSTPDNSVPAFGQGYPYMSKIWKKDGAAYISAQVAVMATKTCRMYYTVLPSSAAAPTVDELKSAAVSSNLGYGIIDLEKNEVRDADLAITVSDKLEEMKNYTLYLWLTDVDGTNSSAVTPLQFTTPDVTPPEFVIYPHVNGEAQAASVPMAATLNENGTIFWVVVESGAFYPKSNPNNPDDNSEDGQTALLNSDYAKLQVANGMNAFRSGQVAATANTEAAMNITGLEAEKSYDLYYLARDTAGNYSIQVYKLEGGIRTLDNNPPTIHQFFTKYDGKDNTQNPTQDTDIVLEFSENVRFLSGGDILSLYENARNGTEEDKNKFTQALRSSITFKVWVYGMDTPADVKGDQGVGENWVIDYSVDNIRVDNVNGKVQLKFLKEGLQLKGGGIYSFEITGLEDMSGHALDPTTVDYKPESVEKGHNVPIFTVVFAQIKLTGDFLLPEAQIPQGIKDLNVDGASTGSYGVDFKFRMMPQGTEDVADGMAYDLLLWTDKGIEYDLYYRAVTVDKDQTVTVLTHKEEDGKFVYGMPNMSAIEDQSGWVLLGSSGLYYPGTNELAGKSLHTTFNGCSQTVPFPDLNTLRSKTPDGKDVYYDFAVSIRRIGNLTDPNTWSGDINFYVDVAAGNSSDLYKLAGSLKEAQWQQFLDNGLNNGGGESIGSTQNPEDPRRLHLNISLEDSVQPKFADNYPAFETTENSVTMNLTLTRPGTVYYAIGYADELGNEPMDTSLWNPSIRTITEANQKINPKDVPTGGRDRDIMDMPVLLNPQKGEIQNPDWAEGSQIVPPGSLEYRGVASATKKIDGLSPNRTYYVYFVIRGSAMEPSEVEIYKFKTDPVARPVISIVGQSPTMTEPGRAGLSTDMGAELTYKIYSKASIRNLPYMSDKDLLSDHLYPGRDLPKAYEDYTIYDALKEVYTYRKASQEGTQTSGYFPTDGSGNPERFNKRYSVFDIYASETVKDDILEWLERDEASGPAAQGGPKTVNANTWEYSDRVLQADQPYYVISMARKEPEDTNMANSATGIRYSFMGNEIKLSDQNPPQLTNATGSFTVTDVNGAKNVTSGSITLTFNKELYYLKGTTKTKVTKDNLKDIFNPSVGVDWTSGTHDIQTAQNGYSTVTLPLVGPTVSIGISNGWLINSSGIAGPEGMQIVHSNRWPDATTASPTQGFYYLNVFWGASINVGNEASAGWTIQGTGPGVPATTPPTTRTAIPQAQSASTNFSVSAANTVDGTSTIHFNAPLYLGGDQPATLQELLNAANEFGGIDASQSRLTNSKDGATLVLKLSGKVGDVSLNIPAGRLTNSVGEASANGLNIKVQQREESGQANMTFQNFYTDISWGGQTWTNKGRNS